MILLSKTVLFILSLISVEAEVLKHEASSKTIKSFTFKEVCTGLGSKNNEMIEAKSLTEIDCMGKVFPVMQFCLNQFPLEKTLARGIVNSKEKKVECEMSASVTVSVSCDKRDLKYCFDPKKGCEELRKIYAYRLEVAHYSLLEKNLNCYFSKSIGENLNEIN
jgi:hypothetical protein